MILELHKHHGGRTGDAILAALRDAGTALRVKDLARAAARHGADAPAVAPTVSRMLRDGTLALAPGQAPGTPLPLLHVRPA
jgi:hypothetical protein